jgi:hypothetical protein
VAPTPAEAHAITARAQLVLAPSQQPRREGAESLVFVGTPGRRRTSS